MPTHSHTHTQHSPTRPHTHTSHTQHTSPHAHTLTHPHTPTRLPPVSERGSLEEKLSNLEDESAAVKVSLIQLLQEKSATNKTLALENSRLNQKVSTCAYVLHVNVYMYKCIYYRNLVLFRTLFNFVRCRPYTYEYFSTTKFSHVFHIRYEERTKLKLHEILTYEILSTRNITKLRYMYMHVCSNYGSTSICSSGTKRNREFFKFCG